MITHVGFSTCSKFLLTLPFFIGTTTPLYQVHPLVFFARRGRRAIDPSKNPHLLICGNPNLVHVPDNVQAAELLSSVAAFRGDIPSLDLLTLASIHTCCTQGEISIGGSCAQVFSRTYLGVIAPRRSARIAAKGEAKVGMKKPTRWADGANGGPGRIRTDDLLGVNQAL